MKKKSLSQSVMESQRRKKIFAVEQFGGECQLCGYKKCINALEFHHLDKSQKEEEPHYVIMRWSWEKAIKELEKCILVCSNCHQEIHYKYIDIDLKPLQKTFFKKQCPVCEEEFLTSNDEQKYCDTICMGMSYRRIERPTLEELQDLLSKYSYVKVGKMYGVSDNAIRKWMKNCNRGRIGHAPDS
jgi:hypothetical protein